MRLAPFWIAARAAALAERPRWPLWLPVALGAGAALYFACPWEPSGAVGLGAGALALAAALTAMRDRARPAFALLAALALGFALAKLREERVAGPMLDHRIVTHLSGRVEALDWRDHGMRVVLDDLTSGAFDAVPRKARIVLRAGGETLKAGQGVGLTADLMPPPGPSESGDSDFGRAAFFDGIGAVGFAYGRPRPAPLAHAPDAAERLDAGIENLRETMTRRIRSRLPGREGAIASALITGERGGIEPDDEAALRDAGLAHVLAIAGLHMALVGMGLFWLVRAVLAAIAVLALNYPIKKWAAGAALAGAAFYLIISGAAASATRAFVMLAMMLLAIPLDRPALSMRSLGLAAAILLIWRPDSITEPGFQMSFAAVIALIAVAEWEQRRQRTAPRGALYRYGQGIAVTSLVGSLATLPFAIFHFDRATHYAVPGNLLAMPVMGFLVMPYAALSVVAMPFGLEALPLKLLGWSIDSMLAIGRFVSGLPYAVTVAPSFSVWALALMALGGLWIAIWRLSWRWLGLLPLLFGVLLAWAIPRPDLLVAPDARTIAVRGGDGRFVFLRKPKDSYAVRNWLLRDGDARAPRDVPVAGHCDGLGCVMRVKGVVVAAPLRPEALAEDCARAAIVISAVPAKSCAGPALLLDAASIARGGGYAVRVAPLKAQSVNAWRGHRPWVDGAVNSAE